MEFAQRGAEVYAVDVSWSALALVADLARTKDIEDRIILLQMDGEKIGIESEYFDLTFADTMLMHADPVAIAAECHRVLRPNGKAIFIEPLKNNPFVRLARLTSWGCSDSQPNYITLQDFSNMAALFRRARHREFYLFSVLLLPLRDVKYLSLIKAVQAFDDYLIRMFSMLRPLCWVTVMEFTK